MAKLDHYSEGRRDGLALALKIVREGGLEALEKEIKFRNITNINTSYSHKELDAASWKIKSNILSSVMLMAVAVLHDEYGFGEKRAKKFSESMQYATQLLEDGLAGWTDYAREVKERMNFEVDEWWLRE